MSVPSPPPKVQAVLAKGSFGGPPPPKPTSMSGTREAVTARWEFRDGPLRGKRKKKAEELPWKEYDIETQRDLDKAYEFRHEYPHYVYKYRFDEDKELEYTIHLMYDDDKMFQTNDGTDVKRPVRRTPLAQVTSRNRAITCKEVQRAAAAREAQSSGSQAASSAPAAPKRKDSGETPRQVRSKSWMHSEHKAGPDTVTDDCGAVFGKIDLENTLYDIVMHHESSFTNLQIPWHLEESKFATDYHPPLRKIGKVDEYLLKVLNKLVWIDCTVDDIYNMVKRQRGRAKVEPSLGPIKQVYRNTLGDFLKSTSAVRNAMEGDIMSGVDQDGDVITDWLEEQTMRLPEHLREPFNVRIGGFLRPRLNCRGLKMESGPHVGAAPASRSAKEPYHAGLWSHQGHEGGVKTGGSHELPGNAVPKHSLKRETPKADSTYNRIVSKLSQPSSKASKTTPSGLTPQMSSDIAAVAERVKQHNDTRDRKRLQAPVQKRQASAEAKPIKVKQEDMESADEAQAGEERGRSRERRRSTQKTGSSAGASSSSTAAWPKFPENPQGKQLWSLLDEETDPTVQEVVDEETVWDPITAEEERATSITTGDDEKTEETSNLDAAMSSLKLSSKASQATPTEAERSTVPAGTASAGETAPMTARSDISSGSAIDTMNDQ